MRSYKLITPIALPVCVCVCEFVIYKSKNTPLRIYKFHEKFQIDHFDRTNRPNMWLYETIYNILSFLVIEILM